METIQNKVNEEIRAITLTDNGKEIAKLCPITYVYLDYDMDNDHDSGLPDNAKDSACYISFSVVKTLFFVYKIYAKQF